MSEQAADEADGSGEHTDGRAFIVVGVDGSDASRAALRWAVDEAGKRNALVRAVGAWDFPMFQAFPGIFVPARPFHPQAAEVYENLVAEVNEIGAEREDVAIETLLEEGSVGEVLCRLADGATMVVLGAREGILAGRRRLGRIAEHVLAYAPCPVIIV